LHVCPLSCIPVRFPGSFLRMRTTAVLSLAYFSHCKYYVHCCITHAYPRYKYCIHYCIMYAISITVNNTLFQHSLLMLHDIERRHLVNHNHYYIVLTL
jgi:hypothetical protein